MRKHSRVGTGFTEEFQTFLGQAHRIIHERGHRRVLKWFAGDGHGVNWLGEKAEESLDGCGGLQRSPQADRTGDIEGVLDALGELAASSLDGGTQESYSWFGRGVEQSSRCLRYSIPNYVGLGNV